MGAAHAARTGDGAIARRDVRRTASCTKRCGAYGAKRFRAASICARWWTLPDLSGTRYELEKEIGRGGLGVVYAARDRDLDRRVALKVMDAAWSSEESRLIARLEHPGIVPVYETGTPARRPRVLRDEAGGGCAAGPVCCERPLGWASDCAWCSAWVRLWLTRTVAACSIAI